MEHQDDPREFLRALHRGGRYHYLWRRLPSRVTDWRPVGEDLPDVSGQADVYFGVHPTSEIPHTDAEGNRVEPRYVRGRLEIISAVNCVFAELDGKAFCPDDPLGRGLALCWDHVLRMDPPPSAVTHSGGGYHPYWLLLQTWLLESEEERKRARRLQAGWTALMQGDPGAKDLARVLRVPGTLNTKYDPARPVELVIWNPDVAYILEEIESRVAASSEPRVFPVLGPANLSGGGNGSVRERLLEKALSRAGDYGGDNTGLWLAAQLRDNRFGDGDALAVLADYGVRATRNPSDPFAERDFNRWWHSASMRAAREPWSTPAAPWDGEWPEFETVDPSGETPPENATDADLCSQPCTDLGNSERLLALYGENLRYVPPWKSWITWNGQTWAQDSETARGSRYGGAYRMAARMVRRMRAQMAQHEVPEDVRKAWTRHAKESEGNSRIMACLHAAANFTGIDVESLDRHTHLLPVANGTVDLKTGELLPHRREDFITHRIQTPYQANAACPAWDEFFWSIFRGKADLIDWIWRVLGYTLTGEVSERVVFFLWGSGRNGKSTLLEALSDLMGEYAAAVDPKVILVQRYDDQGSHEVAQLPGKRYVFTSETGLGRSLNEARIKSLSGADTIQACAKYQHPFSFRPQFKLFVATNHKPSIRGTDNAIWDRMRLIPFEQRFYLDPEELSIFPNALPADKALPQRLRAEYAGALARMVRAAGEWYRLGLGREKHVTEATATYREESDTLGAWMRECCEIGRDFEQRSSELWVSFSSWCDRSGESVTSKGTRKAFGMALREKGFVPFDFGKHDKAHWRGLRLLESETPEANLEAWA